MMHGMDCFATPLRRRLLFAALYLSEGAPIGFLWLALPTRLRSAGMPVEQITQLTAVLVIPWTLKFLWAPLVDFLRTPNWSRRHWVIAAQTVMGLTLLPLVWLDPQENFRWLVLLLPAHAFAAATQDVAIDALCISETQPSERGQLNGWMQTGVLLGRAAMGGGALLLAEWIGDAAVVGVLIGITTFSGGLLLSHSPPAIHEDEATATRPPQVPVVSDTAAASALPRRDSQPTGWPVFRQRVIGPLAAAFTTQAAILAVAFALLAPAAFKALEVVIGPFLIDRGYFEVEVGQFTAIVMIGAMVSGSVLGGLLADRFPRRPFVAFALTLVVVCIAALAMADIAHSGARGWHLPVLLGATAFSIGLFTVAVYALLMDLTRPDVAATQFSAFMGATNGCEAWSTFTMGQLTARIGYPGAMLALCGASLLALPLLFGMRPGPSSDGTPLGDEPESGATPAAG